MADIAPTSPAAAPKSTLLPCLLLMLSATTGLVDAASVLGLGKVFTANMTGNVVFLGFAAVGTPGFKVIPAVLALASFMIGAWGAGQLGRAHTDRPLGRWLVSAAVVEAGLLWIAALIALDIDVAAQAPQMGVMAVIVLTGFAMGLRNATVRQLKVADLTTTVLTLTVTGIAADYAGGRSPNFARRFGAIASIFGGAAVGALLLLHGGLALPLALAGAMVLGATLLFLRDPASTAPHQP